MTPTIKNLSDVRAVLCARLDELKDTTQPINVERARLTVDLSNAIVNTLKVELSLAAILKGSVELPFVEMPERSNPDRGSLTSGLPSITGPLPSKAENDERTPRVNPLTAGPSPEHPWRQPINNTGRQP